MRGRRSSNAASWLDEPFARYLFRRESGEVVGLAGLDGQGQRELLLAFFGVLRGVSGQVLIDGKPVTINSPADARSDRIGIALIPEDRRRKDDASDDGRDNLSFASLDRLGRIMGVSIAPKSSASLMRWFGFGDKNRPARHSGRLSFRRQPAEGGDREMADAQAAHRLLNDPTRGIELAPSRKCTSCSAALRCRRGDPALLHRLRRTDRLCDRVRCSTRSGQARTRRRGDYRARPDRKCAQCR